MKKTLFCILILLSVTKLHASHISGGELFYEYLGRGLTPNTDKFRITMRLYRECSSPGAILNGEHVEIGIYYKQPNSLYKTLTLERQWSTPDPPTLKNTPGAFPCLSGDKTVCFQVGTFSATIELPRTQNGYTLSWVRYSRQQLTNVADDPYPDNAVGATFVTNIPGTNQMGTGVNSSPEFVIKDSSLVCAGKDFTLDYSAFDPDKDSLSYSFCPAYDGGDLLNVNPPPAATLVTKSLPYLFPYTGYSPLGLQVKIDAFTGLISGKAPSIVGKYSVNVCVSEFRNDTLLNIHRKDFILKIGDCSLAAAELKPSYLTCDGFNLSFQNNSTSDQINSYYWEFGDPNSDTDTSISPTPTYNYPDSGTYFVKLVVNRGEACSDSTTTRALVYPGFIPDFDIIGSCSINPYQFLDRTTTKYGVVNSWRWNFGNLATTADTSIIQNPFYQYPAPQSADIRLIVTNSKGCTDTLIKSIVIPDKPTVMVPFRDTLICIIDTLQLQSSTSTGTATFSWSPTTNIVNSNTATPLVFPKNTTTYFVTVNDQGCINTDSVLVNVTPNVQVNIGNDTTICQTDSIQLHPNTNGLYYSWATVAPISDTTILEPFIRPLNVSQYQLTVSVGKCNATDKININVAPYPQANAGPDTSICFGKTTILKANIVASQFTWSPVSSLLNENTLTPIAGPQSTTQYVLTVTDVLGCPKPSSDTITVKVTPRIVAFAGHDTTIVANQALQLTATGGDIYSWSPTTGMNNPNIANPVIILGPEYDTITYKVKVSTSVGCAVYDDIKVTIYKTLPDIFIPTAFTPNADKLNDILVPKPVGIKQFNFFKVFNRWGLMLYSTSQQGQGWDGTYASTPQASGTYVFIAQAIDYNGKLITKKGTVVLIR